MVKEVLKSFKATIKILNPELSDEVKDSKKDKTNQSASEYDDIESSVSDYSDGIPISNDSSGGSVSDDSKKPSKLPVINSLNKLEEKLRAYWKADIKKIIKFTALGSGSIFIISGIFLLTGSAEKVADNVVFGERSVIAAFLIILGVLLITGSLAQRIASKTSFENLYQEVKTVERKPGSKDKKDPKKDKK